MTVDDGASSSPSRGAPPVLADPRRLGAVVGLTGAAVFVFSYDRGLPDAVATVARVLTVLAVGVALWFLFARPRDLGPFAPPRGVRILVYLVCVALELALMALGTRWLEGMDREELRPALIAAVVGLHFLPFAWAFGERMFSVLGTALVLLGTAGLLVGTSGGALLAAVAAGTVMALLLLAYSLGTFAKDSRS